jgi:two-component system, NtrC family, sensor histidine kinase HydH
MSRWRRSDRREIGSAAAVPEQAAVARSIGAMGARMSTTEWRAPGALARARALKEMRLDVAHELKNSLTAVKALVQLGSRNPAEAASHERLAVVDRELARMQETLRRALGAAGRHEEFAPTHTELGPLVSDALLLLSAEAREARVSLSSRGDAVVHADPRRLREAVVNLVANAIEAAAPGGEVVVHVRAQREGAEIVVRDTGRGMPDHVLRRIGTPFFTTREHGSGLGVALARSAIALHGGALHYESEPGRGTTATVTLPGA